VKDEDEFAIVEAPERAITRQGKGHAMKAFLTKKWGPNYAGQTLTNVQKGSIPADVAEMYEDDVPTPNDVVKDPDEDASDPLRVTNDEADVERVRGVAKTKAERVATAKKVGVPGADEEAAEVEATQRRAKEADDFAAKGAKGTRKRKLSGSAKAKAEAGKNAHGLCKRAIWR